MKETFCQVSFFSAGENPGGFFFQVAFVIWFKSVTAFRRRYILMPNRFSSVSTARAAALTH